ncbi:hypothetical protein [Enemella sp. A6]|uniref:hypothetical protein n=1 Tax=Enemella sp. A6 TaxID=3440152 RepID=UPI003EC0B3BC
MMWVLIFAGIAVAGLIMTISYAIWLYHKASDLWSEIEMLGTRADELGALLEQLAPMPEIGDTESSAGEKVGT